MKRSKFLLSGLLLASALGFAAVAAHAEDLLDSVKKAGVQPERFAGGHGGIGNYADVEKVVGSR